MRWTLGPFEKASHTNPCLVPDATLSFHCPMQNTDIRWMEKDVFNPAAVVRHGAVHLIFRAEDTVGTHKGTSRLGHAVSRDGLHFDILPEPVFFPDRDDFSRFEWDGGCEDPRIVESEEGQYVMTYTSYDGKTARLCVATSPDLVHWRKHGPVFAKTLDGKYADLYCKSGAIVTHRQGEHFVAQRINGKYFMYWGEGTLYGAVSEDLVTWTPLEYTPQGANQAGLYPLMRPRKGRFDEYMCEPGPQAVITEQGILLLYNGHCPCPETPGGFHSMYQPGQVLFDSLDPTQVIARTQMPFLTPSEPYELLGQVMPTCFIEGLVYFSGQYFLYYGTADSKVAVAVYPSGI